MNHWDERVVRASRDRQALREKFPAEFRGGARCGFLRKDYPEGFHTWSIERCNAWWAGWNQGYTDREKLIKEQDKRAQND
jgi:hypothetical protein